jgi:hypothetical protein
MTITISNDGAVAAVYEDGHPVLTLDGAKEIRRASHVEPTEAVGGPVLPETATRAEALVAELKWLNENILD